MKISIHQKFTFSFFFALTGIGVLGYTVYKGNQKLLASTLLVQHTKEIIYELGTVLSAGKYLENASINFALSKDSLYLNTLDSAKKIILAHTLQLTRLTADNPAQKYRVSQLKVAISRYINFLSDTEAFQKNQQPGLNSVYSYSKQCGYYIDSIKVFTNSIEQQEQILLTQRNQANQKRLMTFNLFFISMFVLMALFTVLLLFAVKRYLHQNKEKEKRAAELTIANSELAFQNKEKENRAAELAVANKELAFQNEEKEKRAAELTIANHELAFQNKEKEKRAFELTSANKELAFQNEEKEKRAAELVIANKELAYQNKEKEKRASELTIANSELAFQNREKEKRASELFIANNELEYQNEEKEKRAFELTIANKELAFQNVEKEKRAAELTIANTELKEAEEEINKVNSLYAFISQVNQEIVHIEREEDLFRNACRIACEYGKFKIAWIGMFNSTNKSISLVDQTGIPAENVGHFTNITYESDGPQQYILNNGTYYACNNIEDDLKLVKWKNFTNEWGIYSCMLLPIKKSGAVIGSFNLYSAETGLFDEEKIELVIGVANNISFALTNFEKTKKQRAAEELVFLNEKRFRALIEKGTDIIFLSNPDGNLFYASQSTETALGYTVNEFLKKSFYSFIHPDDLAGLRQHIEIILKTPGSSFFLQQRYLHKKGNWVWCEGTVTNMLHEPGVHALLSNFRDISETKITEQQQEFDRNNLKALINNTNDSMWSVDKDFKLITSNQQFDKLIKSRAGNAIEKGSNMVALEFSVQQLNRFKVFYERAFAGETFSEIEHSIMPADFWSEISFYPIRKGTEVIGTACYSRNITKLKIAEQERIKITNDLIQRNKDLEQFTYIVSHNLRSPVANIIGLTDAIQSNQLEQEDEQQIIDLLLVSIKKLDEVIKDLNYILQVKREVNERREVVRFSELLVDIQLSIDYLIKKENVSFISNFTDMDEMKTLKSYLHSIFYNLITNSIKYRMPDSKPVIEITGKRVGSKIELIFKDNGLGIDLNKRGEQVFGLYKRFHAHKEGKGMGLYMVKSQVETLGGTISIKSEVNKGTEFKIEFEDRVAVRPEQEKTILI